VKKPNEIPFLQGGDACYDPKSGEYFILCSKKCSMPKLQDAGVKKMKVKLRTSSRISCCLSD
jgi:hypothetical protein